jgi:hypothetical protein
MGLAKRDGGLEKLHEELNYFYSLSIILLIKSRSVWHLGKRREVCTGVRWRNLNKRTTCKT